MDTEKGKSVVSLRGGTLAVYLNTGTEISQARIIGRNLKPSWQVYIILNNNGKNEYVSIGQADKKVINFNTKNITNGQKEICGAAVGLYGRREFYEGFVEGYKSNAKKAEHAEKQNMPLNEPENDKKSSYEKSVLSEHKTEGIKTEKSEEKEKTEKSILNTAEKNDNLPDAKKDNELIKSDEQTEKADNSAIYNEYIALKDEAKVHDTFKQVVENFKTQMNELEKAGVFTSEEMAQITGNTDKTASKTNDDTVSDTNNTENAENAEKTEKEEKAEIKKSEQNEQTGKNPGNMEKPEENNDESNEESEKTDKYGIDYIFSHNEKLYPFKESPYDWVRVCMDEIWLLPVDKHEILNPFVMLSDLKYSHLMLGRSIDKKVIVLAVPEKFRREDIKSAASFGFKDFWRCKEQQGRGVFGYWVKKLI